LYLINNINIRMNAPFSHRECSLSVGKASETSTSASFHQ
jgi:hypothetical protein